MTAGRPMGDPDLSADSPADLSRRRKAAMVLQILLSDGKKLPLDTMPEDQQLALARELGSLRIVDRATLNRVADEFANELEQVAIAAPGSLDGALAALSGQISGGAVARLRDEQARLRGYDPWAQLLALPAKELIPVTDRESTEVCAVLLSKLPVGRAAELLGLLPGDRARRIVYAMSATASVTPDAVQRIGQSLARDYGARPALAFATPPSQRVGAILNSSQAETRNSVLDALGTEDPGFADQVRKSIFTFPDIPKRVVPTDIPKIIRGIDGSALVTALVQGAAQGGAESEVVDFILTNMSQRMADQLREEMGDRGRVKKSDGEAAQSQLITVIRDRADAGEITLITPEEEDEPGA